MSTARRGGQNGFTLVELVLSTAIISLAVSGTLLAITSVNRHSVDPMVRSQATALAQAYLDEIVLKDFYDPDYVGTTCAPGGKDTNRNELDDVCDYDGLGEPPTDQEGNPLSTLQADLGSYLVSVSVTPDGDSLGPAGFRPATDKALRIDVMVTHDTYPGLSIQLSGYRADYES